jgi:hypothetical protein
MPISSDGLNGYPTKRDPHPDHKKGTITGINGYPQQRAARAEKKEAGIPADQKRRVERAAKQKEKQVRARRAKAILEIFEVPEPTTIPGQSGLYSRWMKDQGDKRTRFKDLEAFCVHLLENYSDDEKDQKYNEFVAQTEPELDAAEEEAEQMYDAIEAAENRQPPKILSTSELPLETFTPDSSLPDAH